MSLDAIRRFGALERQIIAEAPATERVGLTHAAAYVVFRRGVELGVITQDDHDAARKHYGRLWNYTGD